MAISKDMMGVGYSAEQALLMGYQVIALSGAGTASATATVIQKGSTAVSITAAGGATALRFASDCPLMVPYFLYNPSGTTALIFPSTGGAINGGSTDASVNLITLTGALFHRVSNLVWVKIVSAA